MPHGLVREIDMTNGNDAVFASKGSMDSYHRGLSKQEYFAGQFMAALLANPERYKYIADKVELGMSHAEASAKNAHKAVLLADALIEALNKETGT